ncbi:response regulator [Singulisphaera rosea]
MASWFRLNRGSWPGSSHCHCRAASRSGRSCPPSRWSDTRIDDHRDRARIASRQLAYRGDSMMMANDGFEGIESAKAFEPHVIKLDIGRPGMNGYEVAAAIRDHECCRESVFIAVSGYGETAVRERSKDVGIGDRPN